MSEELNEQNPIIALGEKIETLSQNIGKLKRDGKNDKMGYSFVSAEAMMEALRNNLKEAGLSIIPSVVNYDERDFVKDDGRVTIRTIVTMNFKIIDLVTGYSIDTEFTGAEQDTAGKSMQQAITQATKYFLFKTFKISADGEVADGDRKTTEAHGIPGSAKTSDVDEDGNEKPWLNQGKGKWNEVVDWAANGGDINKVRDKYKVSKKNFDALKAEAAKRSIQ